MTRRVVDASITVKWFIPEDHTEEALLLRGSDDRPIAPDILVLELARVLLKKFRRGEVPESDIRQPIVETLNEVVEFHQVLGLLGRAVDVAIRHQRDPFDTVYVALALQERCTFVTADRVLYDALARVYPETMVWAGDLPRILAGQA